MSTLGVSAVMLLAALDGTIVGTAMPRVIAELQGFEHYAAVTTAYMLTATVVVPIVGKLSDLYGRKQFLLLGVAVFTIASALCGAAASMTQLIVFRGIQGLGGGIAQGMAFTTIADLYPPATRGRATGFLLRCLVWRASSALQSAGSALTVQAGVGASTSICRLASRLLRCCSSSFLTSRRPPIPNGASTGLAPPHWCSPSCRCCSPCRGAAATIRGVRLKSCRC
jgi:MFS family permease